MYDPACGTGQMLIHMAGALEGKRKNLLLYGAEPHQAAWALAKVSAFYYGYSSEHIAMANVLQPDAVLAREDGQHKFDVVVAHPPWGVKEWRAENPAPEPHERFRRGMPPKTMPTTPTCCIWSPP